mgnify:CR=1 FL=1
MLESETCAELAGEDEWSAERTEQFRLDVSKDNIHPYDVACERKLTEDDLAEIKALFDKGITLWHNPATFADYSQNNDII